MIGRHWGALLVPTPELSASLHRAFQFPDGDVAGPGGAEVGVHPRGREAVAILREQAVQVVGHFVDDDGTITLHPLGEVGEVGPFDDVPLRTRTILDDHAGDHQSLSIDRKPLVVPVLRVSGYGHAELRFRQKERRPEVVLMVATRPDIRHDHVERRIVSTDVHLNDGSVEQLTVREVQEDGVLTLLHQGDAHPLPVTGQGNEVVLADNLRPGERRGSDVERPIFWKRASRRRQFLPSKTRAIHVLTLLRVAALVER